MKGVVFTELLEMIESQFSLDMVDQILDECDLQSGGAYTSVGTYDHAEFVQIVQRLSRETGTPFADLVRSFGEHLFSRFAANFGQFFHGVTSSLEFLKSIEDYIHVEVRKLYTDAELPSFEWDQPEPDRLTLVYRSSRPFADLAEGLIRGCLKHFGETFAIQREDFPSGGGASFHLSKQS